MEQDINPYEPLLEIKEGNEVFRIHRNDKRLFLIFGGISGDKSNMYELSLSDKNVSDIIKTLS